VEDTESNDQKIANWRLADTEEYDDPTGTLEIDGKQDEDDFQTSLIEETKEALTVSTPWKWLISRLSTSLLLSWPDQAFDDFVFEIIVTQARHTPTKDIKLNCRVHWNPLDFLCRHSELGEKTLLRHTLVATGWDDMVQMTTCGDYVAQTWPLYGLAVLSVVEEAVAPGSKGGTRKSLPMMFRVSSNRSRLLTIQKDQLEQDVCLYVRIENSDVHVECEGPAPIVSQVISQFAWFGAACKDSPQADLYCYSSPKIENFRGSGGTTQLDLTYHSDSPDNSSDHNCWQTLCSGVSVASGFPIRARSDSTQGMELSADAMIIVGGTDYATKHNGHFMLKGFSTMFLPTIRRAQGLLWHFICEAGGPLSYSNDTVMSTKLLEPHLDVKCLYSMRHFVGWVPRAAILIGILPIIS
jgi:hypothetical protein